MKKIVSQIDSTQTELKQALELDSGLEHLSFVQALEQTKGRGRQDRVWQSSAGNLYLSTLLRGPFDKPTWIPLAAAIALKRAIENVFVLKAPIFLKWPNDLVTHQWEKLSGVLCEKVGDHVVVGIGVNVLVVPTGLDRPATSIQKLSSQKPSENSLDRLRAAFLVELSHLPSQAEIARFFEQNSIFKFGDTIEWSDTLNQSVHQGEVVGLGEYGELLITEKGSLRKLLSEEVTGLKEINRQP